MKSKGKHKKKLLFLLVAVVFILGLSYAIFNYASNTSKKQLIKTGTLILKLKEENNLKLVNKAPTSDIDAMQADSYNFTVENTGTETAKYQIYLIDDEEKYQADNCSDKKLPWSKIRFSIIKENTANLIDNLGSKNGIIYQSTLIAGKTDNFKVRLWIDEKASNEVAGLHFHAKLQVKAILENRTDFETGA